MCHDKTAYPRFMLAAGASGSGKTLITCGILQALKNRSLAAASFKCGPDYIDPMFHEQVLHTKSRNLDTFFSDEDTTRGLFMKNAAGADISVMEGVMGYYDGLGGIADKASAYDLARVTKTPAVLVVNTRGMSLSVLAYIKGFLSYRADSLIRGVILNQMSAGIYGEIKQKIEEELGIHVYGYVPKVTDCVIESRHLGLVLPHEVECLEEKLQKLAGVLEESLDIDGLLALGRTAEDFPPEERKSAEAAVSGAVILQKTADGDCVLRRTAGSGDTASPAPVIAVARDEAFCFIYEDNLRLLRELGANIIEFSPIHDPAVPKEADGLLLYGGYPELFAEQLSTNHSMLCDIREKLIGKMPCMAECGGFMYLHRTMEDMQKREWPMAGVIDAKAFRTEKLTRFGYIELYEGADEQQECIRGHEFHYFDSTDNGTACFAKKPLRKRSWRCIHKTDTLFAGFPHLYYYSNPQLAAEFVKKCIWYHKDRSLLRRNLS